LNKITKIRYYKFDNPK